MTLCHSLMICHTFCFIILPQLMMLMKNSTILMTCFALHCLDVNAPIKSIKLKCQPHHLIDDDIKQLVKNRDHKLKFLSRL